MKKLLLAIASSLAAAAAAGAASPLADLIQEGRRDAALELIARGTDGAPTPIVRLVPVPRQ